jgi:hypothetical protein
MNQAKRSIPVDLAALTDSLKAALPLIDNPERRADIERYLASTHLLMERGLHNLLAGIVQQVNEAGGPPLRLEYNGSGLSIVVEPAAEPRTEAETDTPPYNVDVEGDFEKVTIRLPSELKDLIGQAAQLRGLSQNSWYLRELARAISGQVPVPPSPPPPPGSGNRRGRRTLRGFVGD